MAKPKHELVNPSPAQKALLEAILVCGDNISELARRMTVIKRRVEPGCPVVRPTTVWNWLYRNRTGRLPPEFAAIIETAVGGRVTKERLCPHLFMPLRPALNAIRKVRPRPKPKKQRRA